MRWITLLVALALAAVVAHGCGGSHHSSGFAPVTSNPPPPPPPPPPAPPPPGPLGPNDNGNVGTWGQRFVTGTPYTSLLIEVDYISSMVPTQSSLNTLVARATSHCNKGAVTLQTLALNMPGQATWSLQQTYNLEVAQRTAYANGAQAVQYFLYLDGKSDQDTSNTKVLAWTYTGTSTGVFKQSLQAAVNTLVTLAEVEQSVLVHEFGHNLGLVNLGAPLTTNHEDSQHAKHCTNQNCVMYWATESGNPSIVLANGGALPSDYGNECVNDVRANGGK